MASQRNFPSIKSASISDRYEGRVDELLQRNSRLISTNRFNPSPITIRDKGVGDNGQTMGLVLNGDVIRSSTSHITAKNDNNSCILRTCSSPKYNTNDLNKFKKLFDNKKNDIRDSRGYKPPSAPRSRSGSESFEDKTQKRNRYRAEVYAMNSYLKRLENEKFLQFKLDHEGRELSDVSSDDSSVGISPRTSANAKTAKPSKGFGGV